MFLSVVCVSFSMAFGRLLISYTALNGSTIWKYSSALICVCTLSLVITFCLSKSYTCSLRSIDVAYMYLPLLMVMMGFALSMNGMIMFMPGFSVA